MQDGGFILNISQKELVRRAFGRARRAASGGSDRLPCIIVGNLPEFLYSSTRQTPGQWPTA